MSPKRFTVVIIALQRYCRCACALVVCDSEWVTAALHSAFWSGHSAVWSLHYWCHWNCCLGASSVYIIQPCTSLQCRVIRSYIHIITGLCVFSCNLPPAFLAERSGYFTCSCGNDFKIRVSIESWPWRRSSCRDSNPRTLDHESVVLPLSRSRSPCDCVRKRKFYEKKKKKCFVFVLLLLFFAILSSVPTSEALLQCRLSRHAYLRPHPRHIPRPQRSTWSIADGLPSEGDIALLPSYFSGVHWCLSCSDWLTGR